MRNEHKPAPLTHARRPEPVMSTVFAAVRPLRQESSIVHRLRRLHLKRSHLGNSGQEIKHTLILRRRQIVLQARPPRYYQKKQAPKPRPDLRRQLRNRPQTVHVSPHHRRLDLRIQPNFPSMPQRPHTRGKRPAHASKTIMRCGIRPIQTDRHARYPAFLEPVNRLYGQQRSCRRRHIRSQAKPHRIPNQFIKIRPLQGIPPRSTPPGDCRNAESRQAVACLPACSALPDRGPRSPTPDNAHKPDRTPASLPKPPTAALSQSPSALLVCSPKRNFVAI